MIFVSHRQLLPVSLDFNDPQGDKDIESVFERV